MMRMAVLIGVLLLAGGTSRAQQNLLPNPSFEEGAEAPDGWTPVGDHCRWTDVAHSGDRGVSVFGVGSDSSYWRAEDPGLQPGAAYEFGCWLRRGDDGPGGLRAIFASASGTPRARSTSTTCRWRP